MPKSLTNRHKTIPGTKLKKFLKMKIKKGSKQKTGCQQTTYETLYEDHELTEDMAIGPVVLQRPIRPSLRLIFQTPEKSIVKSHRIEESKTDEVQCKICQSSPVKHYTCAHCEELIYSKLSMIAHLRDHAKRTIKCTLCLKSFTSRKYLQKHMITHSDERKFACSVCNRTYKRISSLDNHKLTHKAKRFQCEYCQKRFTQKIQLQVHQRSHTGEKPYVCRYCFKEFTQLTSLKNHILIHNNVKPYCCSFCEKKFRQVSNLKQHVLKNHLNKNVDFNKKRSAGVSLA